MRTTNAALTMSGWYNTTQLHLFLDGQKRCKLPTQSSQLDCQPIRHILEISLHFTACWSLSSCMFSDTNLPGENQGFDSNGATWYGITFRSDTVKAKIDLAKVAAPSYCVFLERVKTNGYIQVLDRLHRVHLGSLANGNSCRDEMTVFFYRKFRPSS